MEFKAYHKIRQFKDVVRSISLRADYKGKDVNHKVRQYFFTQINEI